MTAQKLTVFAYSMVTIAPAKNATDPKNAAVKAAATKETRATASRSLRVMSRCTADRNVGL